MKRGWGRPNDPRSWLAPGTRIIMAEAVKLRDHLRTPDCLAKHMVPWPTFPNGAIGWHPIRLRLQANRSRSGGLVALVGVLLVSCATLHAH
ncbi:hypothetical protein BDV23DRAFT_157946 [Aspergillus alliaceus]|uniref:Uncharacterized protein n=1 Tax=Petromyces alliaceus TaxID=209559 RepID=A0A5N7C4K7_PETAA|nr:hypothetical protein BDV23DRAFT_157946 [Aspergillus alliaceus]